jgi:acetyl esterase/lipase
MASGRRSCLAALLIAGPLLLSGCAADDAIQTTTSAEPTSTSTSTTLPPTTTTVPPTTTTTSTTTTTPPPASTTTSDEQPPTTTDFGPNLGADIRVPAGDGPFPAVVLVHGGGWVAGDPSVMSALAVHLTENGYLTVNTPYQLAVEEAGYPGAVDDVACAARLAFAHPDSNGQVAMLGHSAGAHLSALVALNGDDYGEGCPYPQATLPQKLIGLAGPYDVERLGLLMLPFFGGGPTAEADAWEAGNPLNFVGENTTLSSLIMYGENDTLVDPSFAVDFHMALVDAGTDATLELVEDARHMDLRNPDAVGDLIVTWLARDS